MSCLRCPLVILRSPGDSQLDGFLVQVILRSASAEESGEKNQFGDTQLQADVEIDRMMFERLRACSAVEAASSEEQPDIIQLPGRGYTVGV